MSGVMEARMGFDGGRMGGTRGRRMVGDGLSGGESKLGEADRTPFWDSCVGRKDVPFVGRWNVEYGDSNIDGL